MRASAVRWRYQRKLFCNYNSFFTGSMVTSECSVAKTNGYYKMLQDRKTMKMKSTLSHSDMNKSEEHGDLITFFS